VAPEPSPSSVFGDWGDTSIGGDIGRSTEVFRAEAVSLDIRAAPDLMVGGTVFAVGVAYFEMYFIAVFIRQTSNAWGGQSPQFGGNFGLGRSFQMALLGARVFGPTECQPPRSSQTPVAPNGAKQSASAYCRQSSGE